ncbi:MAG: T9SS type A sorting domain-containing protein [Bacteroidota bacterium]
MVTHKWLLIFTFFCISISTAIAQSPLDLLPVNQATHVVQHSGEWSNPGTWANQTKPSNGAKIHIPMGMELTVDGEIAERIKIIRNDGKLKFATHSHTSLLVETIVQGMMGELEMGTATDPVPAGTTCTITIIDEGDITDLTTPQFEKGLVLMGKTVIYGADKTDWLKVARNPVLGATVIELAYAPSGWEVGDRIAITGTSSSNTPTGDEVAVIQSIAGSTLTLTAPLTKNHSDVPAPDLRVHVANLNRNIIIESENAATASLERGHTMFMHTQDVDINNIRFSKLGRTRKTIPIDGWMLNPASTNDNDIFIQGARTNIRGRYSVHFHRGGVSPTLSPAYVRGCVVEDDPGWAYANHSSYVHFEDNVSYNVVGGAFQTEAGDEIGSFKRNIAIRTINPNYPRIPPGFPMDDVESAPDIRGDEQDFAFQGDGFWIHGGLVVMTGNVASGCSGHGFIYWPEGLREPIREGLVNVFDPANVPNNHLLNPQREVVATGWVPVQEFKDNEAYSAIIGFSSYYMHTQFFGEMMEYSPAYLASVHSTFENFTAWNIHWKGVEVNLSERMTFKNLRLFNDDGHINSIGIDNSHKWTQGKHIYENATVQGFATGMIVPRQGLITVSCGTYSNQTNFVITEPVQTDRNLLIDGITTSSHSSFPSSDYVDIEMENDFSIPIDRHPLYFMFPDRIVLNYGSYNNQRLYFDEQDGSFVPILSGYEASPEGQIIPSQFVNVSNQQLQNTYQMSYGGTILPNHAVSATGIMGGKIAANTNTNMNMPICVGYLPSGQYLKVSNFMEILNCIGTKTNFVGGSVPSYTHSVTPCKLTTNSQDVKLNQNHITLYPNPTKGLFSISGSWHNYHIEILDINGKILQSLKGNSVSTNVDISSLSAGLYLIRMVNPTNNQLRVEKIIKLN